MKKYPDEESEELMGEKPKLNGRPKHLAESAAYLRATATRLKKRSQGTRGRCRRAGSCLRIEREIAIPTGGGSLCHVQDARRIF